ncbi:hypothetical protein ACFYNY_19360 [Streptomyces sp. NPDC006530]|uniref:hypothetical protein n=1 Tax=Streptomyces sp. NPDC006530 TaxID=3364750 RepID=UPI0036AFED16
MSDNTQQPSGGPEPRDPWAPPEHKVPLDKPPVHDQQTVIAMPGAPGTGQNGAPPMGAPGGAPAQGPYQGAPGQPAPGTQQAPGFGAPTPPPATGQAAPGSYGYPAYPQQTAQGYPGYPNQQSAYGSPGWTGVAAPQNGFGTAAMVLGIIACAGIFCWGVGGIVLGALALIFGLLGKGRVGRGEANNRGQALAGIIMGIVGIVLGVVFLVLMIVIVVKAPSSHSSDYDYDYSNSLSLSHSAR